MAPFDKGVSDFSFGRTHGLVAEDPSAPPSADDVAAASMLSCLSVLPADIKRAERQKRG